MLWNTYEHQKQKQKDQSVGGEFVSRGFSCKVYSKTLS